MNDIKEIFARPYVKRFFIARFVSNFGNGMGPIAFAFGVLNMRGGSATELGAVVASVTVGFLVLSPFGGVIADRYGRVRMAAFTDIWGGFGLLIQAIWFSTGHVPLIVMLIVNINFGFTWAIFWPALTGLMPALIDEDHLQKGNSINQSIANVALMGGTATAGFLVSAYGSTTALIIDSCTFIFAGTVVSTFRHIVPVASETDNNMWDDLIHGWRVFLSFRWIVVVVVGFSLVIMGWAASDSILGPLLSLQKFNGAKSWAFIATAEMFGYLVGSLISIKIRPKHPMRFLLFGSYAFVFYLLSLAWSNSLWVIAFFAFCFGINFDMWGAIWSTALQREVPKESLSRVSAFDGMGSLLFRPIGVALAPLLSHAFGLTRAFEIFAGIGFLTVTITLFWPEVWKMQYTPTDKI